MAAVMLLCPRPLAWLGLAEPQGSALHWAEKPPGLWLLHEDKEPTLQLLMLLPHLLGQWYNELCWCRRWGSKAKHRAMWANEGCNASTLPLQGRSEAG